MLIFSHQVGLCRQLHWQKRNLTRAVNLTSLTLFTINCRRLTCVSSSSSSVFFAWNFRIRLEKLRRLSTPQKYAAFGTTQRDYRARGLAWTEMTWVRWFWGNIHLSRSGSKAWDSPANVQSVQVARRNTRKDQINFLCRQFVVSFPWEGISHLLDSSWYFRHRPTKKPWPAVTPSISRWGVTFHSAVTSLWAPLRHFDVAYSRWVLTRDSQKVEK